VGEKANSARILFDERVDRLVRFAETASRQNSLIVNLDLGLEQALERYLAGLSAAEGLSLLRVAPEPAMPSSITGAPPASPSVDEAPDVGVSIEPGARGPELVARRGLRTSLGRKLGVLEAGLPLRSVAEHIAAELGVGLAILDEGGRPLAAARADAAGGPEPPALSLPAAWADPSDAELLPPAPGSFAGVETSFGAAVSALGSERYWVAVAYPTAALKRTYRRGLIALAAAGAAALALAALVTAYFIRNIARPATALATTARRIAEGRYGLTSGIDLDDEVGDIARELDFLSFTLSAQKEQRDVAEEALRQSELQFRSIFDSVDDAIMVHDSDTGAILDANAASTALFGLDKRGLLARGPGGLSAESEGYGREPFLAALLRAAHGELIRAEWRSRRSDGKAFWTELVLRPARIGGANRVLATYRDIDARKASEEERNRSLQEKETLLREIHHRVKNNFQIINSLFSLQEAASTDERLIAALREPRDRIHAMAMVHERLYLSEDLDLIDFGAYVEELSRELYLAYVNDPERVSLELKAEPLAMHIDRAIPCGLILNELVTNALKYAFPESRGGRGLLTVVLKREGDRAVLTVSDDGVGLPADGAAGRRPTLGLTLVEVLAQQLAGEFNIAGGPGTSAELRFPLPSGSGAAPPPAR
jgi:PAS domain S-box-containing protein